MPSTGNIFDVAPHDQETPKEADVLGRSASAVAERLQEGTATILDVAGQASGNAPLTDGFQVGDEGVSGTVEGHGYNQGGNRGISAQSGPSEYQASPADSQYSTISQKQRIDAEMRLIFRSSTFTTLDPADDPRFA